MWLIREPCCLLYSWTFHLAVRHKILQVNKIHWAYLFFNPLDILFSAFWILPDFTASQYCFFTLSAWMVSQIVQKGLRLIRTMPHHHPWVIGSPGLWVLVTLLVPRQGQHLLKPWGWCCCFFHCYFSIQSTPCRAMAVHHLSPAWALIACCCSNAPHTQSQHDVRCPALKKSLPRIVHPASVGLPWLRVRSLASDPFCPWVGLHTSASGSQPWCQV